MAGITPEVVQLLILIVISGFLLLTFWKVIVMGMLTIFVALSFANTTKKDDVSIETYIENGSITKEGIKLPPIPKEYLEDCMIHLKMSEEMCKQTWTQ